MTSPADAAPALSAPRAETAAGAAGAIVPGRCYGFGHGFTFRREAFGGILFHYEGVKPDPRVTFVDSAFLIDLLETVRDRPELPLAALADAVQAHFALDPAERARLDAFFTTLIERGALVPH